MPHADNRLLRQIHADPAFAELERRRARLGWALSLIVLGAYFAFVLVVAFAPEVFGRPVPGFRYMTVGIPVGVAIIVMSFLATGVYVYRANVKFDRDLARLLERHRREGPP